MSSIRLSRALCAAVSDLIQGSHATLEALFVSAGVPGPAPALSHAGKWKEWLFRAGNDPAVDSLVILGNILEEFMDLAPPEGSEEFERWKTSRNRVVELLEESGLRYFRGGRVLPSGLSSESQLSPAADLGGQTPAKPAEIKALLEVLIRGLCRAMHPLTHRRKGAQALSFSNEYDVQDLLHSLLRPWVGDIRPEEYTPSYAGTTTRMDFLLPKHEIVIELKFVRDRSHAKRIGQELIVDIEHYRKHPGCKLLWCVVYDRDHFLTNAEGLRNDVQGLRSAGSLTVDVRLDILSG